MPRSTTKTAATAAPLHVRPPLTTAEAFRVVGRECFRHLLANKEAMLAGDPEALHQMRIALRRMRAALSIFSEVVSDRHSLRINAELRWLAAALGPARDLDVFFADVLIPLRREHAKEPGVAAICSDFERRRRTAYDEAAAAVRSQRFQSLVLHTLAWLKTGPWTADAVDRARMRGRQPIGAYAADELARRRRKLKRKHAPLQELSTVERHQLRIRVKKLRYAIEFFAESLTGKKRAQRANDALSALQDLQDALGSLNDIAARESLASHLVSDRQKSRTRVAAPEAFAAGVIFGAQEARVQQFVAAADRAYARFLDTKPFWK